VIFLKAELLDVVYLQQNAFDITDAATPEHRQLYFFSMISSVMETDFAFSDKDHARRIFNRLRQLFTDCNYSEWDSDRMKKLVFQIESLVSENSAGTVMREKGEGPENSGKEQPDNMESGSIFRDSQGGLFRRVFIETDMESGFVRTSENTGVQPPEKSGMSFADSVSDSGSETELKSGKHRGNGKVGN
jgi:hypothetical protein